MRGILSRYAACVAVFWLSAAASAAVPSLDVPTPYVPSTQGNVDEILRLAAVTPNDVVYDLGSGDGRIVIAAARDWGARGVGVELDPKLVAEAQDLAKAAGVGDRARFQQGDVLKANVSDATVVTLYLLTPLVERLKPRLLEQLKPGTRIVAHEYGFSDWKADRHVNVSKNFYLYVVPARVAGKWQLAFTAPEGARQYDFELKQRFQEVQGGARVAGGYLPAFEPRLSGERLQFVLVDDGVSYRFDGRAVTANSMEGTVRWGHGPRQQEAPWRATRATGLSEG